MLRLNLLGNHFDCDSFSMLKDEILQSHFWASKANDREYPVECTPSLFIVNMLYLKGKYLIIGLFL